MNYTEATIWEVWRHASFVPVGLDRQARQDAWLGGYLIPKVITNDAYSNKLIILDSMRAHALISFFREH